MEIMFENSTDSQMYHHLVSESRRPKLPAEIPNELKSVITQAWATDASQRPTAAEIVNILERLYADELAKV